MKRLVWMALLVAASALAQDWRMARPGWDYQFPRDHHEHANFKTEWWYFTGNLFDERGRRFGFELTFFRQGIIPVQRRDPAQSRWIIDDLKFAHFTITDAAGQRFYFQQKINRGAFGEAGFDRGDTVAWIEDWSVTLDSSGTFRLVAKAADVSIDLSLTPQKAPVVHGDNGVSRKGVGEEHASHYYSITRLASRGTIQLGARQFAVTGTSWFDHEWATNQLAPDQVGWNWLCLQLANGEELMLYQMRLRDGGIDPATSGTWIAADGTSRHLRVQDFTMTANARWRSNTTKAEYPVEWNIEVPSLGLRLRVKPVLEEQELALLPLVYWEGAVDAVGEEREKSVTGVGYLELTGYAGSLNALQR